MASTLGQSVPFVSLIISVFLAIIGWFLRQTIHDLKKELGDLRAELKAVDHNHQRDQRDLYREFVTKEEFLHFIGKTEGLIGKTFDQLRDLAAELNQTIAALKMIRKERNDA